jgi:hypothetical protein
MLLKAVREILGAPDGAKPWKSIGNLNRRLVNDFAIALKQTRSRRIYADVEQMLCDIGK